MANPPTTTPRPEPTLSNNEPIADAATSERVAKTTAPKRRQDTGLAWLALLGLLIVAAIPISIDLSRPVVWTNQEALNIAVSAETFRRKAPVAEAETSVQMWTPVYQGVSRWDLPPGGIWLDQVMYLGLPADTQDPALESTTMITRARIGSVIMALLFVAAVYWAGYSAGGVDGLPTACIAALIAMTMPLLAGNGRFATANTATMAWSALSIAAALWAMRPLRASPSLIRQLLGWLISGIALGAAALTTGPVAVPATLLCTVALAMVCPRRIGHIMGLLASTAVATLLVMPWVLHVHDNDPQAWKTWLDQLAPDLAQLGFVDAIKRAGWRISLAATLCGLWLIWIIPAVSQPFSTSTGDARRKMMLGWVWLLLATLMLAFIPGNAGQAGLLLAVAPACVCIALCVQQFHNLSAEARHARLWLICRWISCTAMILLSIALPLAGYLLHNSPNNLAFLPDIEQSLTAPMHWGFYAGAALALLLACALAVRFAFGNHPGRTVGSLALWLIIAYCFAAIPVTRGDMMNTRAHAAPPELPSVDPDAQP